MRVKNHLRVFPWIPALLLCGLLWNVTVRDFRPVRIKAESVHPVRNGFAADFSVAPDLSARAGRWLLTIDFRCDPPLPRPRMARIFLNGARVGRLPFGSSANRAATFALPDGFRPGQDRVGIRAPGRDWRVEGIRLQNHVGYARGLVNAVVLPKEFEGRPHPPWPALAAVFLALLLLPAARNKLPKIAWAERTGPGLRAPVIVVAAAAAILPFVTPYRLLFASDRLWLFVLALDFAGVVTLVAAGVRWIRPRFDAASLQADARKRRILSVVIPGLVGLFFLSIMLDMKGHFGGNYSRFLRIEEKRLAAFGPLYFPPEHADALRASVAAQEGYDGEFNYFMAFDPFLSRFRDRPATYKAFIDEPAYRYGRVGFPVLIRLFSAGDPRLFPAAVLWLILASHVVGAFFLFKIVVLMKRSPFWTFLYVLVPGFYYSLNLGLGESIGSAFILAGFYAYLRERVVPAAALFAAALFFRETNVLVAIAIAAWELVRRRDLRRAALVGSAAAPYLLWRGFLTYRLFPVDGWKAAFHNPPEVTIPFTGFLDLVRHIRAGNYVPYLEASAIAYAVLLCAVFAFAVYAFARDRSPITLALLLASLLSVSLNYVKVWTGVGSGIRVTLEVFPLLILAFVARKEGPKKIPVAAFAALFAATFWFEFFVMDLSPYFRAAFLLW